MRTRRAQHPISFLFAMVIMAIVLLVAIILFIAFKDTTGKYEEEAICGTQILAHSMVQRGGDSAPLPIVCPTKKMTVQGEARAKEALAQEMKRCWAMWGRGRLQLFGEKETAYCHICTTVRVEDAAAINGLPEYLKTQRATANETYMEYIAGVKRGEGFELDSFQANAGPSIPVDAPIAVIFYYAKGYTVMERLGNTIAGKPVAGAAAGYLLGSFMSSATMNPFFVPFSTAGGALLSISTPKAKGSSMSFVAVRPLTAEQINDLGCQYAPVKNE